MALENPRSHLQLPLLWLLIFALTSSVVVLLRQFSADFWQPTTPIIAIASAWGIFTTRYLAVLERWKRNALKYRAAELVVLAVLLRLTLWFTDGFPSADNLDDYLRDPFLILDNHWWVHFIIVVAVWGWSNGLTALFNELDFSAFELDLRRAEQPAISALLQKNRPKLLAEFFNLWTGGGILLIFVTALATYQLSDFREVDWFTSVTRLSLPPQLLVNLLLYLFVGLWLLSYVRYQVLFSRWLYRGVQPQAALAHSWRRGSLLLLGVVGLLCAFLPIGSTMPLVWIGRILYFIIYSLISVLIGAIRWLLARFAREESADAEPFIPDLEIPQPFILEAEQTGERGPLVPPELTGGLTWVIIVAIIITALLFLTRGQDYGRLGNFVRQLWAWLRDTWQRVHQEIEDRVADMRQVVQEQFGRTPSPNKPNRNRINVNALSPREQIRYYYLAIIKRAADQGVARDDGETPAEFLTTLQDEFPDSAEDSEALTAAFLQARYSDDVVENSAVEPTKNRWQRVRRNLKRK